MLIRILRFNFIIIYDKYVVKLTVLFGRKYIIVVIDST